MYQTFSKRFMDITSEAETSYIGNRSMLIIGTLSIEWNGDGDQK